MAIISGRVYTNYGKNILIQERAERFHELATLSCAADEMNNSLLVTKNDSLFHHSFDIPSCAGECSRMFYSKMFHVFEHCMN